MIIIIFIIIMIIIIIFVIIFIIVDFLLLFVLLFLLLFFFHAPAAVFSCSLQFFIIIEYCINVLDFGHCFAAINPTESIDFDHRCPSSLKAISAIAKVETNARVHLATGRVLPRTDARTAAEEHAKPW